MKTQNKKWLICFLLLGVSISGCKKDYLERTPSDFIPEADVFANVVNAEKFLNNAYNSLPGIFKQGADNNWMLSSGTDESEQIWDNGLDANYFNTGSVNAQNFPMQQYWFNFYNSIRRINKFLNNYDIIPEDSNDANRKKRMLGEAYSLRAYYYFELYRMWGGVPILTQALDPSDTEGVLVSRNSIDEVIAFIKSDVEKAIPLLPVRQNDAQFGRMTSVACKFLWARVALYYASPLSNPSNLNDRWVIAAAAAEEAITFAESNGYGLCVTPLNGKKAYERIFLELNNPEAIMTRFGDDFSRDQVTQSNGVGGWYGTGPTQEMVDAYEMTNGLLPADPGSGYNSQNPYINRDPRFYQTIITQGQVWKNHLFDVRPGGADLKTDHPPTNYFLRKFMAEEINLFDGTNKKYRPWILMRLAELYLNYAEAKNEAAGPDASVYARMNMIRSRAGMPILPAGLTKDQMREKIMHERQVELAFEDHRFWDVRRWKIADITDNRPIHYVAVSAANIYTYPIRETRSFVQKNYLFPIPQSEIDKNPKLKQNPGW
ncbi:RagB/SusD family nutrient uptake outer membrane protein [Pedobacter rhodius]|uniref:RagB/SusD family nutrient uptake outer membrane protein n=1 Tax=Pedobacter rhodius TaxID=3004098 RepID=A0ABT4KYH6_9SPHI|nr:RagB/SusD family nutrient uptake outer membrane protein [Pedobacter sp. SJ11]MCZ4223262.1 RagB/SusD family nutrient uptake outer membrane protein [Pedobacter sp. SJ11]